jgi:hypothetical protein
MNIMESLLPSNVLLDSDSPRHALSHIGSIVLRPHQAAALARCIEIESGEFKYECIPAGVMNNMQVYNMNTRVAALCDKPGAGKSYVVISLCVATRSDPVPLAVHNISHANGLLSYVTEDTACTRIRTNVVVVPHGLVSQWTKYLQDSGHFEDCIVYNRRTDAARANMLASLKSDMPPLIVLCSSTCFPALSDMLTANTIRIRRLFIDEADSIFLGKAELVGAAMYWFVSASLDCMMCPSHTSSNTWEKGIRSKCINTILNYFRWSAPYIRTLLFVRNKDSFVDDSLKIENFLPSYVMCAAPTGTELLRGIVDDKIMHALRTDDIQKALSYVKQKGDSDNIVASLTHSWQSSLALLQARLDMLDSEDKELWSQQDHDYRKSIDRQAAAYSNWLSTVQTRVNEDNLCSICYEKPEHKAIMNCCSAAYCFQCATQWIARRHTCPNCRSIASAATLHVVVDERALIGSQKPAPDILSKSDTAIALIDHIIAQSDSSRILLCCSNTAIFDRIDLLSRHGVAVLKGTGAAINNSVDRFIHGDMKIMCVSSGCYCSGINLPFISDVIVFDRMERSTEDQVIGRAQRPGRHAPLKVWYLVQENEEGNEHARKLADIYPTTCSR